MSDTAITWRRDRAARSRRSRRRCRIPERRNAGRRASSRAARTHARPHHDARARRLVPEERAADRHRLAGHDLGHGVAPLHRVRVHHPGHRLLVRRHVGRRDVELRPDELRELGGEAAGDARQLALRQVARVAAHAALRAAVRQAGAGRTSRSSTWRARRTRRGRPPGRSGCRPSSARAPTSAGRGRPGTSEYVPSSISIGTVRITARSGPRSRFATKSGTSRAARARGRAGSAPAGRAACPTRVQRRMNGLGHGPEGT